MFCSRYRNVWITWTIAIVCTVSVVGRVEDLQPAGHSHVVDPKPVSNGKETKEAEHAETSTTWDYTTCK